MALKLTTPDEWLKFNNSTSIWYNDKNNLQQVLNNKVNTEQPDFLFINGIYSYRYNLKPLLFTKRVKKIVSVRGMLHPGALSQKPLKKKIYLWFWKLMGLHKAVTFHAVDQAEKEFITAVFGNKVNITIAANFPRIFPLQPFIDKQQGYLKLVSVALISPMKNILLVLEALQQLPSDVKIEYDIYGPIKDKQYWQQCLERIKALPTRVKVNFHGDIPPDDIINVLAAAHVFILPSKSENFGHAIIEALSAARPVITSTTTPWNGLETAKAGINVTTDHSVSLKDAIQFFVQLSAAEWQQWCTGAAGYARLAIDLNIIKQQYQSLFQSVQ